MSNLYFRSDGTRIMHNRRGPNIPSTTTQTFVANTFANVTVPVGSIGVIIDVPAANTGTIQMKGVTGDTGIFLHPSRNNVITLDPANLTFGLLCSSAVTLTFFWE